MAQPSTPTRPTGSGQGPHSTPIVHKVSSVFADRIRSHLDPLITRELEDKILPTPHNAFLEHALGTSPGQVDEWKDFLDTLGERKEVKDYVARLRASGTKNEPARYEPFCDLANFILDETQKKFPLSNSAIPLRFARNDPTIIKGPEGARTPPRKPDVVLVFQEIANWLALSKAERSKDPHRSSIYWTDILGAVEFKVDAPDPVEARKPELASTKRTHSSKINSLRTQSNSHSQSRPSSSSVQPKRKHPASTSGVEPPTKKSRSESHTGSVHTGQSGMRHGNFNQLSSYPLEILSSTNGTRSHALSLFVDGEQMQLWFYDRAGAIHSNTQFNFLEDFVAFATVVMALARLSLPQFGVLSFVKFPSDRDLPTSLEGATITLCDRNGREHIVTLTGDVISHRPGIVGRSSFVWGARCDTLDGELVVKFSYQDVSRTNEFELIEHAKDCDVDYIPMVYASQDFEHLSQGPRGKMIPKTGTGELLYTDRVLRIMVSKRYTPVFKIGGTLSTFQAVMRNILECIHQLLKKAHILHRDVSYTNVMAEKMQDGSFRGILNDFDLAIRTDKLSDNGYSSLHRTGTLPFLAVELLTDKPAIHFLRHDLESLFFVLVWISAHFDYQGHFVDHRALDGWQHGTLGGIMNQKMGFVTLPLQLDNLQLTEFYGPLKASWLEPLRLVFFTTIYRRWQDIMNRQPTEPISDETLYKDMLAIMMPHASEGVS